MTDQLDHHEPGWDAGGPSRGEAEALIEALLGFHAALEASQDSGLPGLAEFLR